MANFDWGKVEGYREDMSADEKLALLENFEMPEPEAPTAVPKNMIGKDRFDKVSSELAEAKKQLRARMSEDEAKEADRQAAVTAMQEELAALRKEKQTASHRSSFLSLGFEEELAAESAVALSEGDTDAVFRNIKKHMVEYEKKLRAEILKNTPTPPAGDDAEKTREQHMDEIIRKSMGLA